VVFAAHMRRHAPLPQQSAALASILAVNGFVPHQCYTNVTAGIPELDMANCAGKHAVSQRVEGETMYSCAE
jgi:hypothetical protein